MRLHGRVGTSYMAETPERERTMPSKLDQLRAMTVVVADTSDIEAVRRLKPQDCTTNPTLLLKAVETPAYGHFLDEALHWGRAQGGAREAVAAAGCDRLGRGLAGGGGGGVRPAGRRLRGGAGRDRAGPCLDRGGRRPLLRRRRDRRQGLRRHRS